MDKPDVMNHNHLIRGKEAKWPLLFHWRLPYQVCRHGGMKPDVCNITLPVYELIPAFSLAETISPRFVSKGGKRLWCCYVSLPVYIGKIIFPLQSRE